MFITPATVLNNQPRAQMSAVCLHLFVRRLSAYEPGLTAIVRSCVAPRGKWMPAIECGRPGCPTVLRSGHLEFCPRVSEWHVRSEYQLFAVSLVVTAWGIPHPDAVQVLGGENQGICGTVECRGWRAGVLNAFYQDCTPCLSCFFGGTSSECEACKELYNLSH